MKNNNLCQGLILHLILGFFCGKNNLS